MIMCSCARHLGNVCFCHMAKVKTTEKGDGDVSDVKNTTVATAGGTITIVPATGAI